MDKETSVDPPKALLPDSMAVAANTNSNNNEYVTTASLYVASVPADLPASVEAPSNKEFTERSSESKGEECERRMTEWEQTKKQLQEEVSRVDVVLHNPTRSISPDTSKSNLNDSTTNPKIQASDWL